MVPFKIIIGYNSRTECDRESMKTYIFGCGRQQCIFWGMLRVFVTPFWEKTRFSRCQKIRGSETKHAGNKLST